MNIRKNLNKFPFDNKNLTLLATGLVTASNLIPDNIWRKVAAASSPGATVMAAYIFQKVKTFFYMRMKNSRAEKVYTVIIKELNDKLSKCTNTREKNRIKAQIEKHENDLNDLRIKNMSTFI